MKKEVYSVEEYKKLIKGKKSKPVRIPPVVGDPVRMDDGIFIPGEVRSSKNSKQIFYRSVQGGAKVPFIAESEAAREYRKMHLPTFRIAQPWFEQMAWGKRYPLQVQFKFVRSTKGRCDFNNMTQILCDLMVEAQWLPDDSMDYLLPMPCPYSVDKENPGVYISIL